MQPTLFSVSLSLLILGLIFGVTGSYACGQGHRQIWPTIASFGVINITLSFPIMFLHLYADDPVVFQPTVNFWLVIVCFYVIAGSLLSGVVLCKYSRKH